MQYGDTDALKTRRLTVGTTMIVENTPLQPAN